MLDEKCVFVSLNEQICFYLKVNIDMKSLFQYETSKN